MLKVEIIDGYIKLIRSIFSECSINSEDFDTEIKEYLKLNNAHDYSAIIDSMYLLEDTQLAKQSIRKFGLSGRVKDVDDGDLYLRTYGILNACYM